MKSIRLDLCPLTKVMTMPSPRELLLPDVMNIISCKKGDIDREVTERE